MLTGQGRCVLTVRQNQLPLVRHAHVFHVGSFDPAQKGTTHNRCSLEGNGLSVSQHPEAWRGIARLGDEPTWRLTSENGPLAMVDVHAMNPDHWAFVHEWAQGAGLLQQTEVLRVSWMDEELGGQCQMDFDLQQPGKTRADIEAAAQLEADDREKANIQKCASWKGTPALDVRIGFEVSCVLAQDMALTLFVQDELFDRNGAAGVWWNDDLDPYELSAPRGVIHARALQLLHREVVADECQEATARFQRERCG